MRCPAVGVSIFKSDLKVLSMPDEKIICPNCGTEMNQHATKIDYRGETPELQEVHTCAGCGRTELRKAK